MNTPSIILTVALVLAFATAVYFSIKNKRKCCGNCSECMRNCGKDKNQ